MIEHHVSYMLSGKTTVAFTALAFWTNWLAFLTPAGVPFPSFCQVKLYWAEHTTA
jgi:hypothetical protein